MMTTAKLLLHCPDKPGILAEVTDFITVNKGNIIYQRHLFINIVAHKLLIFVATAPSVWDAQEERTWVDIISDLKIK